MRDNGFARHGRLRQDNFSVNPKIYTLKFSSIYKIPWNPDSFVYRDSIVGAVGRLRQLADNALPACRQVDFLLVTETISS
jgi:hypothetical protein